MGEVAIRDFDAAALYRSLDAERVARNLTWRGVAEELWALSSVLNARRNDHPISASTLTGLATRHATSCQHALFMLRWLDASPEDYLVGPPASTARAPLPQAGADRRLRWNLGRVYEALNAQREERSLTWPEIARELGCTPSQLTHLRRARFATGMGVAMRVVQWLGRPAADFIEARGW